MVITSYSSSNQPIAAEAPNPSFFGASSTALSGTTVSTPVTLTPPPYTQSVTVQPPSFSTNVTIQPPKLTQTINGVSVTVDVPSIVVPVTVNPNPVTIPVTATPSPVTTTVSSTGQTTTVTKDAYESVGIVAGNPPRLCALVSKNIVAAANHYPLTPGMQVSFYGASGNQTTTVKSVAATYGDLELYYLNDPITAVSPANLLAFPAPTFFGKTAVTFGLNGSRTTPPFNWTPVAANTARVLFAVPGTGGIFSATLLSSGFYIESGDSGAPSFVTINGQIYYLGSTHKISSVYEVNMVNPWIDQIHSL